MKLKFSNNSAAILILTLLFMSGISFLAQHLFREITVYIRFCKITVNLEQAKMLALGGINLAISDLIVPPAKKQGEKGEKEDVEVEHKKQPGAKSTTEEESESEKGVVNPSDPAELTEKKLLLKKVLPHLNRWQVFKLTEKVDGIEGEIKICISSEDGKININEIFDFQQGEFKKDFIPLLQKITLGPKNVIKGDDFIKKVTEFFKKRKRMLDDVSELKSIEGFRELPLFYQPPKTDLKKGEVEKRIEKPLFDLFTIWTNHSEIDMIFLSDSMCDLLKMRRPQANDATKMKEKFNQVIKKFKLDLGSNWVQNWEVIQPIYDKKPNDLEKIQKLFSQKFDPKVYSVISSGKVNGIEQNILAILIEQEPQETNKKEDKEAEEAKNLKKPNQQQNEKKIKTYKILKIYWI